MITQVNGNANFDLMDAVFNPEPIVQRLYCEVTADVWQGALEKGVGKVLYDPAVHKKAPLTIIELHLNPVAGTNLSSWDFDFILQFNDGWRKVVLPSMQALGLSSLRDVHGKFAVVELVTAGSFKGRDGDTVEKKAPKFIAVFDTLDELTAAWVADRDGTAAPTTSTPASGTPAAPTNGTNGSTPAPAPAVDNQREVAMTLLPALVGLAKTDDGFDRQRLADLLAKNAMTAKYFTVDSPEVVAAMEAAKGDPVF